MKKIEGVFSLKNFMWLALVLAMTGSITHVAFAFSTLENNSLVMGYIQALAVDVGMLSLAVGITQRKRMKRKTLAVWVGAGIFTVVSIYANLLHGAVFQLQVEAGGWEWLLPLRPILLSAILPVMVLYLVEVSGDDENALVISRSEAEKVQKAFDEQQAEIEKLKKEAAAREVEIMALEEKQVKSPDLDKPSKSELMERFLDILKEQGNTPLLHKEIASKLNISTPTMSRLVTRAKAKGLISGNGRLEIARVANEQHI